jgi:peptide/nickel transport system substrate-binding protein
VAVDVSRGKTLRKPVRAIAAITLAVAMFATACGGSSGDDATDEGGQPTTDAVATTGGSSTVIQPVDATSLDPTTIINSPSQGSAPLSAIYDGLYTVDRETDAIEPRIATDFSSPDGITWTLTLRPDVTFSDGTAFDATAVKTQWEKVKGNIRSTAYSYIQDVTAMNVVDATTLEVVLGSPNRQFFQLIPWSPLTWIPSPTAVAATGADFGNRPVGAGPFVLESRTPGSETVLVRNPTYWQEGLPKLDTLRITTITDPQQAYDTLTTGGADSSLNVPDVFAVQAEEQDYTLLDSNQIGGAGWLFGTKRAPFDDIRARKAVYLALDMDALNDTVANGAATVPKTLFPEGTPFHNPDVTFPEPDAVEAQRLFDELAAEGNPVSFTIVNAGGNSNNQAIGLQTQLAEFDNVDVEVQVLDGSSYGTTLFSGDFDLAVYGFGGSDPEPALASMRSTHVIPIASMGSPEIDQLIIDGREATDRAGRQEAYDALTTEVGDLYRMLFMNVNHAWAVESPEVTGMTVYGQGTSFFENYGRVG